MRSFPDCQLAAFLARRQIAINLLLILAESTQQRIWLCGAGIYSPFLTDTETPMKTKKQRKLDRSAVGIRLGACAAAIGGTAAFAPDAQAQITTFNTPIPVPQTSAGVYVNLATGATGTSQAGTPGWDFNPYSASGGTQLGFYWAAPAGGVASTTSGPYLGLHSGDVVGPGSTYTRAILGTTGSPFVTTGTTFWASRSPMKTPV